jgi:hypothetical protein
MKADSGLGGGDISNSQFYNVVMNPQQFMYLKLQEKRSVNKKKPYEGGFVPMQYILQQLLSNDPQRFVLNEKEASRHSEFVVKGNKDYNKEYTQWRAMALDDPKPFNDAMKKRYPNAIVPEPEDLSVLPPIGRTAVWRDYKVAHNQNHEDAHPLSLCIRGLDLDHITMTYKDLSNNTATPYSRDVSGEFLKGLESDFQLTAGAMGATAQVPAYKAGHIRREHCKNDDGTYGYKEGRFAKYGPALHLTEGNYPQHYSNLHTFGRRNPYPYPGVTHRLVKNVDPGITFNVELGIIDGKKMVTDISQCASDDYWGNKENLN